MSNIDTQKYVDFVKETTSAPSLDYHVLASRLSELEASGANVTQMMTAAFGLSAEAGEFTEVVKKIVFQGKPYTEENIFHMKRELGDIMWYLAQACMALDISIDEVIQMNFDKLSSRYPEGSFSIDRSENREQGDV
jgi:NTP pyrophosphatase (non-canonical NTP hydrolase)